MNNRRHKGRDSESPRKILVGMIEVAGQYRNLSYGLTAIGVEHDFITYSNHALGYGGETKTPFFLGISKKLRLRMSGTTSKLARRFFALLVGGLQSIWAIAAIFRYDVFLFGYGSSLLPWNVDLPILKLLGKTVISNIGHGSEARAPYLNGKLTTNRELNVSFLKFLIRSSRRIAKKVQFIQKYSAITIGSPYSSSFFVEDPMINRLAIGRPVPTKQNLVHQQKSLIWPDARTPAEDRAVRILHCPSDRTAKGTAEIVSAVDRLRDKGYNIDFRLLEGVSNAEVLAEISKCDFVIDQLYSDLPMSAISTEAAMYGKPSIVAGYDLDALRVFVPEDMWPPIYLSRPEEIEISIEDLILNKEKRYDIGMALFEFINSKWSAESYAGRYMRLVSGDIPLDWWFDPKDVDYLYGCGQSMETTRDIVSGLVRFGGINCLQLRRKEIVERNPWIGIY